MGKLERVHDLNDTSEQYQQNNMGSYTDLKQLTNNNIDIEEQEISENSIDKQ